MAVRLHKTSDPKVTAAVANRVLPESARWLLAQGRLAEAKQLVQKAASGNRKKLSSELLNQVLAASPSQPCLKADPQGPVLDPYSTPPSSWCQRRKALQGMHWIFLHTPS
jgi:hypothetical protein